jgi:hypothetical protein
MGCTCSHVIIMNLSCVLAFYCGEWVLLILNMGYCKFVQKLIVLERMANYNLVRICIRGPGRVPINLPPSPPEAAFVSRRLRTQKAIASGCPSRLYLQQRIPLIRLPRSHGPGASPVGLQVYLPTRKNRAQRTNLITENLGSMVETLVLHVVRVMP